MEFIIYLITRITLVACLVAIIYVITAPEEKMSDNSDTW